MSSPTLQPLRSGSRGGMVGDAIRSAIYSGKFQPGDSLREIQIARELGVSQTTVREALLQLEHAGLVVREANRGTRVTNLTNREIAERVAVRVELETMAAREAAKRMTPDDFARLRDRLYDIADAVARNDYFESAQADLEFHREIWRLSDNATLYRTLDNLSAPFFAFVSVLQSSKSEFLERSVRRHKPIVAAIQSKDPERIRAVICDHIEGSYRKLIDEAEKG